MANITTQTIRVDLSTGKVIPTAFTHQNDTARTLVFDMYNGGMPYTMTGNTVKFAYKSPIVNGQYSVIAGASMASGTVSGNKVSVTLPVAYTQISGVGMLTMIITPTSGTVRPVNIRLVVQKSADGDDVVAGASDIPDRLAEVAEQYYSQYVTDDVNELRQKTKNLINSIGKPTQTVAGVANSIDQNRITFNGTATENMTKRFIFNLQLENIDVADGTTLTLSYKPVSGSVSKRVYMSMNNKTGTSISMDVRKAVTFTYDSATMVNLYFYVASGAVFDNFTFDVQLEVGSVPTTIYPKYIAEDDVARNTLDKYATTIDESRNIIQTMFGKVEETVNGVDISSENNRFSFDGTATSNTTKKFLFNTQLEKLYIENGAEVTLSYTTVSGKIDRRVYMSLNNQSESLITFSVKDQITFTYNSSTMDCLMFWFESGTVFDDFIIDVQLEVGNEKTLSLPKGSATCVDAIARYQIENLQSSSGQGKGFLFQDNTQYTNPTDCAWIKGQLYIFQYSSNDDHTEYTEGRIFNIDYIKKKVELAGEFTSNLGHCNSVSYNPYHDALICGNGGNSNNTEPNEIYIIKNASSKNTFDVDGTDTIRIDVSQLGWGKQLNVIWGDSDRGRYSIAYAFTNYEQGNMSYYDQNNVNNFSGESKRYIRRLMFGLGTNNMGNGTMQTVGERELNGTFKVLNTWEREFIADEANNGSCFYGGNLYEMVTRQSNGLSICKHKFRDFGQTLETEKINVPLYYPDGSPLNREFEGLDISPNGILCSTDYNWIRLWKI